MLEYTAESNGDDVGDVKRHRGERKDGICRDRRRKVEQAGEDAEDGREPNCAQGGVGPFGNIAKVTFIRETCVVCGRKYAYCGVGDGATYIYLCHD